MTLQIAYQSVWEQTLTIQEKLKYESLLNKCTLKQEASFTCPIAIKGKKNKGIVATTFICNNSETVLHLTNTKAELLDEHKNLIAEENFELLLEIPPFSAMPWSFVFNPTHVKRDVSTTETYSIQLSFNEEKMD
ncbi:SLAP domain-containing protein [Sporosarcina sp. CAU 1771]